MHDALPDTLDAAVRWFLGKRGLDAKVQLDPWITCDQLPPAPLRSDRSASDQKNIITMRYLK
jgi:hypothetical protein